MLDSYSYRLFVTFLISGIIFSLEGLVPPPLSGWVITMGRFFGGRGGGRRGGQRRGSARRHQQRWLQAHGVSPSRAGQWTAYGGPLTGVVEVYFDFWLTYVHVRFRGGVTSYTYLQGAISTRVAITQIGQNSGLTRYLTQGRVIHSPPPIPRSIARFDDQTRRGFSGPLRGGGGGRGTPRTRRSVATVRGSRTSRPSVRGRPSGRSTAPRAPRSSRSSGRRR